MDLDVTLDGGDAIVRLQGELDAHRCAELATVLDDLAVPAGGDLVIDAAGLSFIDSSGLSTLLDARERVLAGGGRLVLQSPQPAVRRVIEITGLSEAFGLGPAGGAP